MSKLREEVAKKIISMKEVEFSFYVCTLSPQLLIVDSHGNLSWGAYKDSLPDFSILGVWFGNREKLIPFKDCAIANLHRAPVGYFADEVRYTKDND